MLPLLSPPHLHPHPPTPPIAHTQRTRAAVASRIDGYPICSRTGRLTSLTCHWSMPAISWSLWHSSRCPACDATVWMARWEVSIGTRPAAPSCVVSLAKGHLWHRGFLKHPWPNESKLVLLFPFHGAGRGVIALKESEVSPWSNHHLKSAFGIPRKKRGAKLKNTLLLFRNPCAPHNHLRSNSQATCSHSESHLLPPRRNPFSPTYRFRCLRRQARAGGAKGICEYDLRPVGSLKKKKKKPDYQFKDHSCLLTVTPSVFFFFFFFFLFFSLFFFSLPTQ